MYMYLSIFNIGNVLHRLKYSIKVSFFHKTRL